MLSKLNKWFKNLMRSNRYSYDFNSIYYKYHDFSLYEEFCFNNSKHFKIKPIRLFNKEIKFNLSPKEVTQLFGKHITAVNLSTNPSLEVYLYKLIEDGEKQKILFHYFENRLILVSRVFPYATEDKVLQFQNLVVENSDLPRLSKIIDRECFRDKNNDFVFLIRDVEYTEHYLTEDSGFKDFIKSQIEAKKEKNRITRSNG